jgi:hypothetical protein
LICCCPFIFIAAALNPEALYTSKMARKPKFQHAVTMAIKKLSSSSSKASAAIDQYTFFRKQAGLFGGEEAKDSTLNGRASAGKSLLSRCILVLSLRFASLFVVIVLFFIFS